MLQMPTLPTPDLSSARAVRANERVAPRFQPCPASITSGDRASSLPKSQPWMLVGVDGSEESSAALRWAANQSGRFGAVVPATAWRYPPWALARPAADQPVAWPESALIRHAKDRASSVLRNAEILDRREHLVEERATGPMLVANSADADLLVLGARRRGQAASTFAGSVGGYCIAQASVPVALVPSPLPQIRHGRVIVGMDNSPEAHAALRWAVRHTDKDDAIHVIHVAGIRSETSGWLRETVAKMRSSVDRASSPRLTSRVSYGPPVETLALAASGADMLVLGARSRGRIGHALLGSVTTSLCRRPSVVTVVVPSTSA